MALAPCELQAARLPGHLPSRSRACAPAAAHTPPLPRAVSGTRQWQQGAAHSCRRAGLCGIAQLRACGQPVPATGQSMLAATCIPSSASCISVESVHATVHLLHQAASVRAHPGCPGAPHAPHVYILVSSARLAGARTCLECARGHAPCTCSLMHAWLMKLLRCSGNAPGRRVLLDGQVGCRQAAMCCLRVAAAQGGGAVYFGGPRPHLSPFCPCHSSSWGPLAPLGSCVRVV